ncbi:conserved hypothetical protein, partial [Mucor ambiguus]
WVNNPTLTEFCFSMIGRADIEESKSNVAMNAWLPQASYPCGHTFMVCIHTENQNQGDFYPFILHEISVLVESPLGHLRYLLTDVPPQPNSPLDNVNNVGHIRRCLILEESSSTGSSFPADSAKPVPLAVVSLDNSQIPLVRTSSKLVVKRKLGSPGYEDLQAKSSNRNHLKSPRNQPYQESISTQPLEPILIPKLRIYFADFPYLHCSIN